MVLTKQEIKKRYFDKAYEKAPLVPCACGCGQLTKSKDHYGREKKFINGHNNRKYDDPTQYKREWNHRNRPHRRKYKSVWIKNFKRNLILKAGNKCSLCGLEFDGECTAIFDFHHRDPSKKEFNICNQALNKYGKDRIMKEATKCDLLCANCHRLIHWNWEIVNTADPQEELKTPTTEEKV